MYQAQPCETEVLLLFSTGEMCCVARGLLWMLLGNFDGTDTLDILAISYQHQQLNFLRI